MRFTEATVGLLNQKVTEFHNSPISDKTRKSSREARQQLDLFLRAFPFRQGPHRIDELTPERLYKKGDTSTFFWWIEFGTKMLAALSIYAQVYRNAVSNIGTFKELLRKALDDEIALAEKVDARWEQIPRFGGDKHIAKKIVCCYYPEDTVPILNTSHIEHMARCLRLDGARLAHDQYSRPYEELTIGERWQLWQGVLLALKEHESSFSSDSNGCFMGFLYWAFNPPTSLRPDVATPLSELGLLWSPKTEQEVIFVFSKFHRQLGFPFVLEIKTGFPDCVALDSERNVKRIKFELFASNFDHPTRGCDYIVCWEDDFGPSTDKSRLPTIISLKDQLQALNILRAGPPL